jgi:phytoene dehydrogenase-like protein
MSGSNGSNGSSGGGGTRRRDVIVVGGGHNGLVCAAYLARAGRDVLVLERRDQAGGVLAAPELMQGVPAPGPVHSVGRLAAHIARDLRLDTGGVKLLKPDARLTSISADGRSLTLWSDPDRAAAELRSVAPADVAGYRRLDRDMRTLAGFAARIAAAPPPDVEHLRASDLTSALGLWMGYLSLGRRRAREFLRVLPMPIGDVMGDYLEDDQLRAAIAWRGVRYTTMAPSDAGSAQVFLADMVRGDGGVAGEMAIVVGGPAQLAEGLVRAAQARGAQVRTGAEVARINARDGRVTGVVLADGEEIGARQVVSGLDPKRTLLGLLDPVVLGPTMGWEAANLRQSGGTSAVLFALRELPAFSGVSAAEAVARLSGRILFGADINTLDRAADAIKAGRPAGALVLEGVIPTLLDPSLVPGNGVDHLMSVVVHGTPYRLRDGDWDAAGEALGDRVVAQLSAVAPAFADLVVARRVLTPLDLEREYCLTEGHPMHLEPALDQWFAWRPLLGAARYRLPLDGLFLCGAGAHPGGGVTGMPGFLAAREVLASS